MSQLDQLVQILGYRDYNGYTSSHHWGDFKRRWFEHNERKCDFCGSEENIQLHHKTYERLGRERFKDVQPLCRTCRKDEHNRLIREGYYPRLPSEKEVKQFRNESKKRPMPKARKIRKTDMRPWCSGCGKRIVMSKRQYALEKLAFEEWGVSWRCGKCRYQERISRPIANLCKQIRKKVKHQYLKQYEKNLFAMAFLKHR